MVITLLVSGAALAATPTGADTAVGSSETGISTSSTNQNISAGNLTQVAVDTSYVSNKWTGFYGNISGSFILSDASGNNFFQWTVADMSGAVVYASNDTVNWGAGSFFPLAASFASPWLVGSASDNYTNTFNATENFTSPDFFSGANEINATPFVETFNSTGGASGLKTYGLMNNATNQSVFAAKVLDDTNGFTNQTVDYQMLVPAFSVVSYYFYIELP
jgi:hypothetical protein